MVAGLRHRRGPALAGLIAALLQTALLVGSGPVHDHSGGDGAAELRVEHAAGTLQVDPIHPRPEEPGAACPGCQIDGRSLALPARGGTPLARALATRLRSRDDVPRARAHYRLPRPRAPPTS